jgi:hypothetical protein
MRTSLSFACAAALFAGALAGCSSTLSTPPVPQQSSNPVTRISVQVTGTLKFIGSSVVVTAKQGSYTGPFTFTSSNGAVLALSLPADAASGAAVPDAKQTLVSPDGIANVIAVGPGSATVTITGASGATATPALLQVKNVPSTGRLVLSPARLAFSAAGSANAKSVNVAQGAYAGTFSESDTCAKIAGVSSKSGKNGVAEYVVTPLAPGSCKVVFTGGQHKSATLPISVALPPGGVRVDPASLHFTSTLASDAQTVAVSQSRYTGSFTESDTCAKIATLDATKNAAGKASYTVKASGAGSCDATFAGGDGKSGSLKIDVTLPGPVVVKPASVSFTSALASDSQTVAVSQSDSTAAFTESDTCTNIATLAATTNAGGKASYTVKPSGPGSCQATFNGGGGKSAPLQITVTLPAPVVSVVCAQSADACSNGTSTTPGSVQFTAVGDTATVTPSDPQWANAPNFSLQSDTCNKTDDPSAGGNWATLAPAVGKSAASFTIAAQAAGTTGNTANCVATFVDGAGRTVKVNVEVTLGGIGINGRRAPKL